MNTSDFFHHYYKNARTNSILILDSSGYILDMNYAFTLNFGYAPGDLTGKHFSVLFTEADRDAKLPELELERVLLNGQSHDENYVIDSRGKPIWSTGESILIVTAQGEKYIVKDTVNLQSKRQLQLFLKETEELLERIFESSRDIPMLILDSSLKVQKANAAFLQIFEIDKAPINGSRLTELSHPFWQNSFIKEEVSKIVVSNEPFRDKEFILETKAGEKKRIRLHSKVVEGHPTLGKKIFIVID